MIEKKRIWAVISVAVLLGYGASYGILRQQQVLVRTGLFHNSYVAPGLLAPDAGWTDSAVSRPAGSVSGKWLEVLFWPQTLVEATFWNTLGRRWRAP